MYTIAVIDDNPDTLFACNLALKDSGFAVETFDQPGLFFSRLKKGIYDAALLDMNFSKKNTDGREGFLWLKKILEKDPALSVVMCTAFGDIDLAVASLKEGARDFITKPWRNEKLVSSLRTAAELCRSNRKCEQLETRVRALGEREDSFFQNMIGESAIMKRLFETIRKIAVTDAAVLINGENGTGKELVARAIHRVSPRSGELFFGVDMGAIPENLFESEMFGHVKGAFTDAFKDKPGKMELAHKGTLFLDEIANIAFHHQPKLLRCLETRELTRIGAAAPVAFDVRLISATNRDLKKLIAEGAFREDLFYRLKTIEIEVPPLRERKEDIPLLFRFFLDLYSRKYNRAYARVDHDIETRLMDYAWPGNVRELKHLVERAVILCDGSRLTASFFPVQGGHPVPVLPADDALKGRLKQEVVEFERNRLLDMIRQCDGNISLAAKKMGIGRQTFYRKMKNHGID